MVALKYKDGIVLGYNNTLTEYGMHLFDKVQRHFVYDTKIVFSASGEFSDFQALSLKLDELDRTGRVNGDKHTYSPENVAQYIASLCYHRRCKGDPYYIEGVVAGLDKKDKRYLGYVDLYGTYIEQDYITTGFSRHLCGHIINTSWNKDCELATALEVMEKCFKALFVKNCPAREEMLVVVIDKDGIRADAKKLQAKWDYVQFVEKESLVKEILQL